MKCFTQVNKRLTKLTCLRFGGGGHDVVIPNLDKSQSWIKGGQFISLEGFEDTNFHPEHASEVHPYGHMVGKNIIS